MNYPELDCETAGYRVVLRYLVEGAAPFKLPGTHASFQSARERAVKARDALRAAGETGISALVLVDGERPSGFPRNGEVV